MSHWRLPARHDVGPQQEEPNHERQRTVCRSSGTDEEVDRHIARDRFEPGTDTRPARERAALGWTEALTRLSEGHNLEGAREALQAQFTREEQVKLTLMINVINGWNRIAVGFRQFVDPGEAKSVAAKATNTATGTASERAAA
jgi:alkylhydroperoxidase family enzyme